MTKWLGFISAFALSVPMLFAASTALAAVTVTAVSPTSGSSGNFSASYTGSIGPSARVYVFTNEPNWIASNQSFPGTDLVVSYPSGTSPISVNLSSIYSSDAGAPTFPSSGTHTYMVLSNTVSTNCTNGTYSGCISNGGTVSEHDYTLTFGGGGGGGGGGYAGFLSASSSAAAVGAMGQVTSANVNSLILLVMLTISVPLAFWVIESILIWFEVVPEKKRGRR